MQPITIPDLVNGKIDVDHIEDVATSTAPTATDRFGNVKRTMKGVIDYITGIGEAAIAPVVAAAAAAIDSIHAVAASQGYLVPVAYTAGLNMTLAAQTVSYGGSTYAPILDELPFTTSGVFEAAKFRLIQGVSGADVGAPGFADVIGFVGTSTVGGKLTDSGNVLNEGSNLVDRLKALTDVQDTYLIRRSATEIAVGSSQSATMGTEYGIRMDDDGLLLIRGGFANTLEPASVKVHATNLTGSFVTSPTNPSGNYTTVIGAYFDLPFTGTGLDFNSYKDDRGGLWHFSIDGGAAIPISVWASVGAVSKTTVAAKGSLGNTAHTCRATYQGADPAHAPSSGGNGRGWLIMDVGDGVYSTGNALIDGPSTVVATGVRPQLMQPNSICDVAINVRPASQPSMVASWFPKHGTAGGVARGITRSIYVNGANIGADIAAIATYPVANRVLRVFHKYQAFCSADVAGDYPLWDGWICHTIRDGQLEITHTFKILTDTFCAAGYLGMLPSDPRYCDRIVFPDGSSMPISVVAQTTNFSKPSSSAAFINSITGNAVAAHFGSLGDTLGLSNVRPYHVPSVSDPIFLEERTDNVSKLYHRRFYNEVLPAGTVYRSHVRFFLAAAVPQVGVL